MSLTDTPDWWRGAVVYQVYPRSFQDSNGDGIGDLPGITARLPYIAALGVDAVWLSPFFTSPMQDFGYDVSDYRDVDPIFGTLADFDALIAEATRLGIRVIIDLVLSHTSDQHPWFIESRSSRDNPRADWYVWAEPKADGTPPNNWLSVFGGSSWEWDTSRRQYYLHNFLTSQPDLNFHSAAVQDALLDVARFWLERGVSGFRFDTANFYVHDAGLRDNPPLPASASVTTVAKSNPYGYQLHLYDKNRPENLTFLERLRAVMDAYPNIASVGELGTDHDVQAMTAAYTEGGKRLHMTYSFELLAPTFSAGHIRSVVAATEAELATGWAGWAFSNHDVTRVASRWGAGLDAARLAPLLVAVVTSLRGSAFLYQGEELGLSEADVPFHLLQDPYGKRFWPVKGRDGCRTPMPWGGEGSEVGFTSGTPWLPIPDDHRAMAVAAQESDPASVLHRVRRFLAWRKAHPALLTGSIRFLDTPEPVLAFVRTREDRTILCAFNLSGNTVAVTLEGTALPGHGFEGDAHRLPPYGAFFAAL